MSINWVMLHETQGFVKLPGEKPVWQSSPRTALNLTTPRAYPAHQPLAINSNSGTLYLTNQRIVYLPDKPTTEFKSFSAPLLNLHDSHITVPWFGPNAWQAMLQPVPGGNIPAGHSAIELKLTFKEGGAPDFHTNFERIKERLQQAVEAARDSNTASRPQNDAFLGGVNMDAVHLEDLPSYEASSSDRRAPQDETEGPPDARPAHLLVSSVIEPAGSRQEIETAHNSNGQEGSEHPQDGPPGYEETQHQSLQEELDRRLSQ